MMCDRGVCVFFLILTAFYLKVLLLLFFISKMYILKKLLETTISNNNKSFLYTHVQQIFVQNCFQQTKQQFQQRDK